MRCLNKAQKEWGWIDTVPYIHRFKEKSQRLRWLTHSEANRLLKELPEHTKAMAIFTLATGLRESNVTGLLAASIAPCLNKNPTLFLTIRVG